MDGTAIGGVVPSRDLGSRRFAATDTPSPRI